MLVNTKNRNMPHPLHHSKINGKMKYFTDAFLLIRKVSLAFLLIFSSIFIQNGWAQCDILLNTNRPNDTLELSLNAVGEVTLNHQILFPGVVSSSNPNGLTCDTVLIYATSNAPTNIAGNDSTFTCSGLGTYTFFVAIADRGNIAASVSPRQEMKVTIVDDIPPMLSVTPRDTILDCLFIPKLTGNTNPDSITFNGFAVTENCGGQVTDTSYTDTALGTMQGDTVNVIRRIWQVNTMSNGMAVDTQFLYIRDTIDPFWDSIATVRLLGMDNFVFPNDSTLTVTIDTSSTAGRQRYAFYQDTTQFKPIAVDYCLGATDTIVSTFITKDTIDGGTTACEIDTIKFSYFAIDGVGNKTGTGAGVGSMIGTGSGASAGTGSGAGRGNFMFSLIVKDTTAPVVMEEPFNGVTSVIRQQGMMDTIIVNVDSALCNVTIDSADIDIVVQDAVSGNNVTYAFRIDTLNSNYTLANQGTISAYTTTNNDVGAPRNFDGGQYKVNYFYRDACLNVDSTSFILDVRTVAPVVMTAPTSPIVLLNDPDTCGAMTSATDLMIMAQDTFDNDGIVYRWKVRNVSGTAADTMLSLGRTDTMAANFNQIVSFFPVGEHEITYYFRDTSACPTVDSAKYTLLVRDTMPGKINYTNTTFGANDSLVITISPADNCEASVNWREPNYSNFMSCSGDNAVFITRRVVSGPDFQLFLGQPSANDNRGMDIDVDIPVGETTIRYVFTSANGSQDSTDLYVNIIDNNPPVFNCPTSVTITRSASDCMGRAGNYKNFVTDDCLNRANLDALITQTPAANALVNDGDVITLTLNLNGTTSSCNFTVDLTDLAPVPIAPLPKDTTVNCSTIELFAPRATVCGSNTPIFALPRNTGTLVSSNPRKYRFSNSETTIVWEFFDASTTQVSRVIQEVTYLPDNVRPVANCVFLGIISPDSAGRIIFSPEDLNDGSSDNCTDTMNLKFSTNMDSLMNCDSIGKTFEVMLFVEDEAGNRDTCSTFVTVEDALAPTFVNVPASDSITCTTAVPALVIPNAIDNCGGALDTIVWAMADTTTLNGTPIRPDTLANRDFNRFNYKITRTFFARDKSKNVATAQQIIVVTDMEAPVIPYGDTLFVDSDANITDCSATFTADLMADIRDVCTDTVMISVSFDNITFTDTTSISVNIPMGQDTIWIRAEDAIGNVDTQRTLLRVRDRTAPTAICKDASVSVNALGILVMNRQIIDGGSFDNCPGALTYTFSQDTFRCSDVGVQQVIMTVMDAAGNSSTCQSTITIQDFTGSGSLTCPANITVACDADLSPDRNPALGTLSVTNLCQRGVRIAFNDIYKAAPANSSNICQVVERNWMLVDTASNTTTTCTQIISLVDNQAPVFDTSFVDATVNCIGDASTADSILVEDNCANSVFARAQETITIGTNQITLRKIWTATDSCNVVADTQIIVVTDVLAPTITLPVANDTFVYNTGDFVPDSCGVLIPTLNFADYVTDCNAELGLRIAVNRAGSATASGALYSEYLPVGDYQMEVVATDTSGNVGRKDFVISIKDTSTPNVVCVGNRTISLGAGGTGTLQLDDVFSSATDNCSGSLSIADARLSKSVFDCSDLGMQQVTLFVKDATGNEGTCTVDVNVINNGSTDVISITTSATPESISGANDGSVSVAVTGGSGNLSYLWTPGNATTATVNNLSAGLYTVVVSDLTTGCRLTDTARVGAGATVNYVLGNDAGNSGDIIQIPVVVSNFDSVAGFSMKLRLDNTNVAQFVSGNEAAGFNYPNLANAFQFQNVGELDVFISNTQGTTLADGATLFLVNVRLTGMAGQTSTLSVEPLNTSSIETIVILNGTTTGVASTANSVTITVGDGTMPTTDVFGGTIRTIEGSQLADVTVTLSGDSTGTDVTDTTGKYEFAVRSGQNLTVRPAENRQHNQGLRVTDLAIIQNHILGNVTFTSPYQYIAADVNDNKRITVTDLAEIQAVILGIRSEFFTAPSWKFIPADYAIGLGNPLSQDIPDSISTVSANADFIAIKMGDVNSSATTVALQTNEEAKSRETFRFGIEDSRLKAGEVIKVPFKADNFQEMYAYQMTLNANPEWLSFEGVEAGALADIDLNNFGLQEVERGLISTLWFAAEPQNIEQNATLFTISFRVNKGGRNLSDILRASSDRLDAAAYAIDAAPKNISLNFENNTALEGFELFQNKPNPFSAQTTISFSVPKATTATLRFYDFSGRRVHQIKGNYGQGTNNVVVHKNDLAGSGVLYYEIETPEFTARKKMIVLD